MARRHGRIGQALRGLGPTAVLAAALLVAFAGLVARPDRLIVDADRSWVDEGYRPGLRPIGNDLTGLFLPRHLWMAAEWRDSGRIPLWDPRGFAGRPNAGNPQAGPWYPPVWLAWASGHPAAPGWLTVAHLFWAGIGAAVLGRAVGLGGGAATACGAAFMLNPYVIAQVHEGHLPHVWAASWYPWAFLGAILLRRGDRAGRLLLPASLATSLMAGHPQEGIYLALALGGWAAIDLLTCLVALGRRGPRSPGRFPGGGIPPPRSGTIRGPGGGRMPGDGARCRDTSPDFAADAPAPPPRGAGDEAEAPRSGPNEAGVDGEFRRPILWFVALTLAAGLSAVEWVPVAMARPWAAGPLGGEGGRVETPYRLHPSNLMQLLSPRALGGPADYIGRGNWWETLLAMGWVPIVLATLGVAGHPDRRAVLGWGLLLGMSLAHAAGRAAGLAAIVGELPGLGGIRVPARSLFLAAMAAAMLTGMGVDAIARSDDRARAARTARRYGGAVGLIGVVLVLGLLAGLPHFSSIDDRGIGGATRWISACGRVARDGLFLASLVATGAVLTWGARRPDAGRRAASVLVLIAIAELSASAAIALPTCPPSRFLGPDSVALALGRTRPAGPARVRARDAFYPDLHAWRDGVEKTNLGDLFQVRHAAEIYRALYPLFDEPDRRPGARLDRTRSRAALDRLNVARLLADRPLRIEVGPVVASGRRDGTPFAVVANPTALPRAYVVPRVEVAPESEMLGRLPGVDPRAVVLLASDPLLGLDGPRQPFTPAEYEPIGPDRVRVLVSTEAAGLLVVLDTWMPGWSATVDGRPAPVLRGDHAFRVVPLTGPGRHEVVLSYRTPGLATGAVITALAALLIGVSSSRASMPPPDSPRPRGISGARAGG